MAQFLLLTFLGLVVAVSCTSYPTGESSRQGFFDYLGRRDGSSKSYPPARQYRDNRHYENPVNYEHQPPNYYRQTRPNSNRQTRPDYYRQARPDYYRQTRPDYYEPSHPKYYEPEHPEYYGPQYLHDYPTSHPQSNIYKEFHGEFQYILLKLKDISKAISNLPAKIKEELEMMPDGTASVDATGTE